MPEMPDLDSIMQMAQNAQAELQKAQDNLDKVEVEGAAGGGLVKIRATAKVRILGVDVSAYPRLLKAEAAAKQVKAFADAAPDKQPDAE